MNGPVRISWVIAGDLSSRQGRIYSPLASLRYRCLIPAEALIARGHQIEFIRADELASPDALSDSDFGDVVVFTKSFHLINEALAARARALNRRIVVDFCDLDFTTNEPLRDHRETMAKLADRTVAASTRLAELISEAFGVTAPAVISDPFELPVGTPRFASQADTLRLLWYGHPGNMPDLLGTIDGLAALGSKDGAHPRLMLRAITADIPGLVEAFAAANRKFAGRLHLDFAEWSLDAVSQGLAETDLVILPSAPGDKKSAKSANRVVEALHAGRFAVAGPIPAYEPFADYIRLGDDIAAGVRWVLDHTHDIEARIRAGQDYVHRHHSPDVLAARWDDVIRGR